MLLSLFALSLTKHKYWQFYLWQTPLKWVWDSHCQPASYRLQTLPADNVAAACFIYNFYDSPVSNGGINETICDLKLLDMQHVFLWNQFQTPAVCHVEKFWHVYMWTFNTAGYQGNASVTRTLSGGSGVTRLPAVSEPLYRGLSILGLLQLGCRILQ